MFTLCLCQEHAVNIASSSSGVVCLYIEVLLWGNRASPAAEDRFHSAHITVCLSVEL